MPEKNATSDERVIVSNGASEIQTLAGRIKSLTAAIDDALEEITGANTPSSRAIVRIMHFNTLIEQQATDIAFTGESIEVAELHGRAHHA